MEIHMASKKFIVREGFVVVLALTKPDGSTYERTYEAGEELTLEDDQATLHRHKLEVANQKDRDAALAAEKQADIATKAVSSPIALINSLVAALSQAQVAAGVAPAPSPDQAPA
jgi:uncharacterized membrane protein